MRKFTGYFLFIWTAAFLTCATITAYGAGFDLPDLDAFAVGRGMAVVATADNPSAIYYNPAGISQLSGGNARTGIYGIDLDPSYTASGTGKTIDNENQLHAVPQLYYTYGARNCPVTLGLGIYTPFGLGLEWPQDSGFRTVTGALRSSLTYLTFNPVMAIKLAPNLAIGGGVSANYAYANLKQGLLSESPGSDYFEFKGDGWAVGYNLGLLWQPWQNVSLGATFRSSTTVNLQGHTAAEGAAPPASESLANAEFSFPLEAVFGISYRPTPEWNFEFDADYADWSALGTVVIHQQTPPPALPLSDVPVTLDWQSSWYFEWGATRYLNNGWHVSAGYIFNENSVPDANYTPAVADLDRHFFSVGIGRKGGKFDFDVAYQFGWGPTRTVTGASGLSAPANGKYDFISNALAASVEYHF
ncbi:MAG: outer membrane protein transport protein [Verrucomicrobia bacterium]|nr:outer membrane protein transport protein [Verrucomicrobiota bacterium]MDE3097935.1 outer membrane protein transport protein [Verrucomicrobiota bacterium]